MIKHIAAAAQYIASDTIKRIVSTQGGGYWDFGDKSNLFQDVAGTVPITAAGQYVALVRDKSGSDKHLTQATPSLRPVFLYDSAGRGYCDFSTASGCTMTYSGAIVPAGVASWIASVDMQAPVGSEYRVIARQYTDQTSYPSDGVEIYGQFLDPTILQVINRVTGTVLSIGVTSGKSTYAHDVVFSKNGTQTDASTMPNASTGTGFAIGGLLGSLPGRGVKMYAFALYSGRPGALKAFAIKRAMVIAGLL